MDPPALIVTIMDMGVALVQLNRPKKRNALSQGLIDELTGALGQLDHSPTVLAVVLTSSGPFCGMSVIPPKGFIELTSVVIAGADLGELEKLTTAEA
jgi:enoyl-CoA hydratase